MPFIVQTASAKMPNSVRSPYRRVAVIETKPGVQRVAMISPRARGVVRIVQTWERLNVGRPHSTRSAYAVALREAETLAVRLNEADPRLVTAGVILGKADRDPIERAWREEEWS